MLGKSTAAALRVPLSTRVRQIELALERLRWLPQLSDGRMVWLNIPMFLLWASDAGGIDTAVFDMKAVVGRAIATPTPVLVGDMDDVIFRPVWNVPRSILLGEILPKIARDPNYLSREDMEIVRGDADRGLQAGVTAATIAELRKGVLRVRQRPGPNNALGLIKFVVQNPEGVYLHGTPAQALFARSRRDFSYG